MQLTRARSCVRGSRVRVRALALLTFVGLGVSGLPAAAESRLGATTTLFRERGGPLNMTVLTPSAQGAVDLGESVNVQAGWSADVVTGASVAVVDAPSAEVDAITSATKLNDTRHTFSGGIGLRHDITRLDLGYAYGFESDYRSHSFRLAAAAELFERNTVLEIAYGRGFDRVCDLAQGRAREPVERRRMPTSDGCFQADDRESRDLSIQTFQGGWTQAWAPIFVTQLTLTAQVLNGFQANPYRGVWLGRVAAQENHPENRQRYSAFLSARLWLDPLKGALQVSGRAYRDTWDIVSMTGEAGYEQAIGSLFRVRGRARYYTQSGAAFFSDDYALEPRGRYFTGDRELSPMSSWTFGGRLTFRVPSNDRGEVLGFLGSLDLVGKADIILMEFREFRYGAVPVPNDTAWMITAAAEAGF